MFESVRVSSRGKPEARIVGIFKPESNATPNSGNDARSARARSARMRFPITQPSVDSRTRAIIAHDALAHALKRPECTGDAGSIVEVFDGSMRILLVGLGVRSGFTARSLRTTLAGAGRRLAAIRCERVEIALTGPIEQTKSDAEIAGQSAGECLALLGFDTSRHKGVADQKPKPKLHLRAGDKAFRRGLERGVALGESANLCRMWANTPPNIATPMWMANEARRIARGVDSLSVRVLKGAELEKENLTGLINVGKASENEPCLIRVAYTPKAGGRSKRPGVIIGKTMTYDTGGLSIKPAGSMKGMKEDKDGGCAALAAMHAIATVIRPPRPVVCLLVAAENSISNNAYRPDDVLMFRNGVTVEVTNTDAEGRLVLADALCWAEAKEKPEFIVDLATLTGGVVTALGSTYAGLWCEDDTLRSRFEKAADDSGERVWRLPMHQEYRDMMKSAVADIVNSNPNRKAHPIQGAAFLSYFVRGSTPWCHLDIAGVYAAEIETGPYAASMPTGWGVLLLASLFSQE